MKNVFKRLFQIVMGHSSDSTKALNISPSSSLSVGEPRISVPLSKPVGAIESTNLENPNSERSSQSQVSEIHRAPEQSRTLSQPCIEDLQRLLKESERKFPFLVRIIKSMDISKMSDDEKKALLRFLQNPDKLNLLKDLYDRKEQTNRYSSSSPVGGR